MFVLVLRFVLIVLFILAVVTQVIIPGILGRPVFPVFRNRKKKEDLRVAKILTEEAELEQEIKKEVRTAEKIGRRR